MKLGYLLRRCYDKFWGVDKKYTSLISKEAPWVYVSYISDVFYKRDNETYMRGHQSRQETIEIVNVFNELGYNVFLSDSNHPKLPNRNFKILFGIEPGFVEAYRKYPEATKIYYATGAYSGHQNSMIINRTDGFSQKHHYKYPYNRLVVEYDNLEVADAILQIGSKYTVETYPKQHRDKIVTIHQSCVLSPECTELVRNYSNRKDYMWLGGGGCILKGLDLVVDYFKEHPELTIHIVGSIEEEFIKAYHHSFPSNVIFHGFMNVASEEFMCIVSACNFLIYPSCTEGMPGSVITSMYYGIIPIVSRWAAFDEIDEMGYLLAGLDEESIQLAIDKVQKLSDEEVENLSLKCVKFAQNTYNLKKFKEEFKQYIQKYGN